MAGRTQGGLIFGMVLCATLLQATCSQLTFTRIDRNFVATSAPPQPTRRNSAVESPNRSLLPTSMAAVPTNAWWSAWVTYTPNGDTVAVELHPYRVKVLPTGLYVSAPRTKAPAYSCPTCSYTYDNYEQFVQIRTTSGLTAVQLERYDDLSATFVWRAAAGGAVAMRATLMQGMPYMTVEYVAAVPVMLWSPGEALLSTGVTTGTKFKVVMNSNQNWVLYSGAPITVWQAFSNGMGVLQASGPLSGVLRLAVASPAFATPFFGTDTPPAAAEALLDTYSQTYPTGGSVTLGIQSAADSPTGKQRVVQRYTFSVASLSSGTAASTANDLLLFALPHHRQRMAQPDPNPPSALYWSDPRGNIRTVVGTTWDLAYEMPDVRLYSGVAVPSQYLQPLVDQLLGTDRKAMVDPAAAQVNRAMPNMADMARTALIADELASTVPSSSTTTRADLTGAAYNMRQRIRTALSAWLMPAVDAGADRGLVYDNKWGGIVSYGPMRTTCRDCEDRDNAYGNPLAHYGPLLYAAAAVAADPTFAWSGAEASALRAVVRSIANPRCDDPYFPPARAMDWWAGHSWASGLTSGGNDVNFGRYQESSSVAVAAYYSIALLGQALKDPALQAWGTALAAIESASAQAYFQVPATGSEAFPYSPNGDWYGADGKRTAGVVYQSRTAYITLADGANPDRVVTQGLQWVPFLTGASDLLLKRPWIDHSAAFASAGSITSPFPEAWRAFLAMAMSYGNQDAAWWYAMTNLPNGTASCCTVNTVATYVPRHSKTAVLHWIATRNGAPLTSSPSPSPSPSGSTTSSSPSPTSSPAPTASPSPSTTTNPTTNPANPACDPLAAVVPPSLLYTPFAPVSVTPTQPPGLQNFTNAQHNEGWGTWYHRPTLPASFFPHPTNSWWSSWTHNSTYSNKVGEEQVGMHPWRAKLLPSKLQLFPPQPLDVQPGYMVSPQDRSLSFGAAEGLVVRQVVAANELGATVEWRTAAAAAAGDAGACGQGTMRSTMLQGMPYMTVRYVGLTPTIEAQAGSPITWLNSLPVSTTAGDPPTAATGTVFKVKVNSGAAEITYKLYFSSTVTLLALGGQYGMRLAAPYTGVLRLAMVQNRLVPIMNYGTDPSLAAFVEQLYDSNADIYPTGAVLSYGYQTAAQSSTGRERGIVRITFSTASMSGSNNGQLMMMSMPHHRTRLIAPTAPNPAVQPVLKMSDIRGELQHVLGSDWMLAYDMPDVSFSATDGYGGPMRTIADPAKRTAVINALNADASSWAGMLNGARQDNVYFGGTDMSAIGRMALIADELIAQTSGDVQSNLVNTAAALRSKLQSYLTPRLVTTPGVPASMVYDTTWGGLIPYGDAAGNKETNFGNRAYNDHHYHYGYYLYAAAALAKGSPAWAAANRQQLMSLVRDFANPVRADPWFPFARHMDWWGGHSWAGGFNALGDGKNQESTSEAVHAYYAVALLGQALGDSGLARWGQLLTAIEIAGAQTYWQMPSSTPVYPQPFAGCKTVGILWGSKMDYSTWFGNNPVFMHGIQLIPFTPVSEALLPRAWVSEAYPLATAGLATLPPGSDGWHHFMAMERAILDPAGAWSTATVSLANTQFYGAWGSHPRSVVLHWIATRPGAGGARRLLRG